MTGGITASELADLELAYAPQFGSAKDPVNMLGYVADNHRAGLTTSIQWHEVDGAVTDGAVLLDVRTTEEHEQAAIPGSVHIPLDDLRGRLHEIPSGPVVVYCAAGVRGHSATRVLRQSGREAHNLDGGYRTWAAADSLRAPEPACTAC
jgi:rhodanese-related sulfurtransferase